ncbi:MAG: hypothetical protein GVY11_06820 [Gammaproteobacteria bacterium]|jgi:hypothetical protein|nr:hypothetical protein [Gammaproteobacteria bacterium]
MSMSEHSDKSRSAIRDLIVWCVATPILSVWALISLLPMVSVIRAWGDAADVFIALAFLATSALGLAAGAASYRLLLWTAATNETVSREARTARVLVLSVYALVWLTAYGIYTT